MVKADPYRRRGSQLVLALLVAVIATFALLPAVARATPDYDGDGHVADDCAPFDPNIYPGAPDRPDLSFQDTNCDGIDGDASHAVFVSLSGNNAATGTKDNPLRTIQ